MCPTKSHLEQGSISQQALSDLPEPDWLQSDPLHVDPTDPDFAPPALTNQWASLVVGRDFFSYAGLNAPPYYQDGVQAEVFIAEEGQELQPGATLGKHTYTWLPSHIRRACEGQGLRLETVTALSVQANVVMSHLQVQNTSASPKKLHLFIRLQSDVRSYREGPWPSTEPIDSSVSYNADHATLSFVGADREAHALIGSSPPPHAAATFSSEDPRWTLALQQSSLDGRIDAKNPHVVLTYALTLEAGEVWDLHWLHVLAGSHGEARAVFDDHYLHFGERLKDIGREWQVEWQAAFTPGNARFSGYLPVLQTEEEKLKRLYYMGVLNLLYCKRTPRWGQGAWVYATGFPSSAYTFPVTWVFPWDTMMVSGILSMLDPQVLKRMIEGWLEADLHQGCAVDFLSGRPVGFWYAVNDYALTHMVYQYVRYTGDQAWLSYKVRGKMVLEHLIASATYYKRLAGDDSLADYGGAENLLECVSSYTHKVASFNAANVWNARTTAQFCELHGDRAKAEVLREQARELAEAVQSLYVPGEGYWNCKQPDGSLVAVRHCLDFFTVMQCMAEDLKPEQREEMVQFFLRELKTSTWMHALSPLDPDATFSSRTDHQDEGAYTTWPAYCLEVLVQMGHIEEALAWLGSKDHPGIADVTRQGPFGQAYCHGDDGSPRLAGAGAKAPMEPPHIEKPVLLPGGKYAQVILEVFAGLDPKLGAGVELNPVTLPFSLSLTNVQLRGTNHHVTSGAVEANA